MNIGSLRKNIFIIAVALLLSAIGANVSAEDVIVYTAHQDFNSRIYILGMDGTVYDWFQYDMFRMVDLEVVDGQVHVADAFAPRSFKLDLQSGELDLVIDDWSLFYFYDIAYDSTYLYVTEWDMNRYLPDGTKESSAGFDYEVFGSAYCSGRLWTLNEDNLIRSWDISLWPVMAADTALTFAPPSVSCRGLSYDGENFWSAEALDSQTGYIYCFDQSGTVVHQILEPAYTGWAACVASGYESALDSRTWGALKRMYL